MLSQMHPQLLAAEKLVWVESGMAAIERWEQDGLWMVVVVVLLLMRAELMRVVLSEHLVDIATEERRGV